jgi:hypothetical protein
MLISGGTRLRQALFAIAVVYFLAAVGVFAAYWSELVSLAASGAWKGELALALLLMVALVALAVWFVVLSGFFVRQLFAAIELSALLGVFAVTAILLQQAFIADLSLPKFILLLALLLGSYWLLRRLVGRYFVAHWIALVYPLSALYLFVNLYLRAVHAETPEIGGWGVTAYLILAGAALGCFWLLMQPLTRTLTPLSRDAASKSDRIQH